MPQDLHESNLRFVYPERSVGGFTKFDGTIEFYLRINSLIHGDMTVLDFGAGRGAQLSEAKSPYRANLATLKGKVKYLVGADVDNAVLQNPYLDEATIITIGKPLPYEDGTFDLIYADWVLEHVSTPSEFTSEIRRLLKPDGWFCARTPNRWGMTGIGTNLIPNKYHTKLLNVLQPSRQDRDVFPTAYRMNTNREIKRLFPREAWNNFSYYHTPEPGYIQGSRWLLKIADRILRMTPEYFSTNLHIFVQKKP